MLDWKGLECEYWKHKEPEY